MRAVVRGRMEKDQEGGQNLSQTSRNSEKTKTIYLPEVISSAENEVGFGVESGPDLAQSAVATAALKTVFVPEHVQSLQQVPANHTRPANVTQVFPFEANDHVKIIKKSKNKFRIRKHLITIESHLFLQ